MQISEIKIAVIGLGYVGLPLAVELGKNYPTLGFDIKEARVQELLEGRDSTREVTPEDLANNPQLQFSSQEEDLKAYNFYIIAVPTPIDRHKQPNLRPLQGASSLVGRFLSEGDIVVYESTVYPGATEEICVPILEQESNLTFNKNFSVGYSPERINPGDKLHCLTTITKVTAGSNPEAAEIIDTLYASIVKAGTYKASSIKVAEAAKVIENTQRDVNIALVNELSLIFHRMGIDTNEVLDAAATKWNFLPFRPGLVGGHCIGVDPYYLTHKAQETGYNPEMILAGRRINDNMGAYVVSRVVKLMLQKKVHVKDSKILILGLTFKENCPDIRNTKVVDVINEFTSYGVSLDVYDPWVDKDEARQEYNINLIDSPTVAHYDAIVLCVAHGEFKLKGIEWIKSLGKEESIIYDVKNILPSNAVDGRL
ncbi:nucleotide sugar dehydrogenase [Desulfocapsa sulfexigens DSM 10523]|uniref:Nucleotide sugar dehydrogenase n=1 Tax=Desulfocapsa sulfexigens (strain DSM 10523 / SB164P1) TaxID=1167006 RepID=M1PPN7_DESSD|nr:Vi polysaccharide biosynthesis UDP-N-acetylglucosamine C-6 dehydrogenase TviB [Desulfocapsa sulfexigens]AGF78371.1 nucleotide sugar dehydrogenase [Desulfocapsa sulfexigens DSM 10523]